MKTLNTISLQEIKKVTEKAKDKQKLNSIESEKNRKKKETEKRKEQIEQKENVSFFVEEIQYAAKKGKNKYSIEIDADNKDFVGDVLVNGRFKPTYLSTYDEMSIIEFKAISKKLKEFSPRIFTKSVNCDNSNEDSYDHINRFFEYREWKENHTFVEFTW